MRRTLGLLVAAYFLVMAVAVTYPGYIPANTIRPLVLGFPFSLAWQVFWIFGSIAVLGGFYLWEKKDRPRHHGSADEVGAGDAGNAEPPDSAR